MWSSYIVSMTVAALAILGSLGLSAFALWLVYRPKPRLLGYAVTPSRWKINYLVWGLWGNFKPEDISRALVCLDRALLEHKPEWRDSFQRITRTTYVQFHPAEQKYGKGKRLAMLGFWGNEPVIAHGFLADPIAHVVFEIGDRMEDTAFIHEMIHRLEIENTGSTTGAHSDLKLWVELERSAKIKFAESRSTPVL